jgi:hypothetical protein
MNRRLAIAGLALVAALGLTGCSSDKSTPAPAAGSSSAPAAAPVNDPAAQQKLVAGAAKLAESTFTMKMSMGEQLDAQGAVDPKAGKAQMSMSMGPDTKVEVVRSADTAYLKFGGTLSKVAGDSWLRVDASKLRSGGQFSLGTPDDPAGAESMLKAATVVTADGANGFKGSFDVAKAPTFTEQTRQLFAGKSTVVPFSAKVDDQGRLVELAIEMGTLMPTAGTMKSSYADFGAPVTVKVPAQSQVKELPSSLAGLINA